NLECSRTVCHDGGDHVILIGRVEKLAISERRQPMIYSSGTYRRMGGKIS
ncbi:MAG: flavin reductase family protein, partial [Alphaproteobacteria bacterium]|nr:flavin reductase family protein [Alphaproteobacteria bacterium]